MYIYIYVSPAYCSLSLDATAGEESLALNSHCLAVYCSVLLCLGLNTTNTAFLLEE